jgi:hypothetical protein
MKELENQIPEMLQLAAENGESSDAVTRNTIVAIARDKYNTKWCDLNEFMQARKVKRGKYSLESGSTSEKIVESVKKVAEQMAAPTPAPVLQAVQSVSSTEIYVPKADPNFIPWGEFKTVKQVVQSKQFFPLFIAGMSGNGKTVMVEQACAKAKSQFVRVQISPETDEDDLIGGFRLIEGQTVFQKGPVIHAMENGATLCLDEIDRGSNKIMCLQGVLEGKPLLIKKTGEVIIPAEGFNVIATANTLGRGDDEGRYSAAMVIDDAFLERFIATIEQNYPNQTIEKKILSKLVSFYDIVSDEAEDFVDKLTTWAQVIRKTFENDGVDESISTRRLCHIMKSYSIFNDKMKAIQMCISRFDEETSSAFLDLYTKVDANEISSPEESEEDAS